MSRIIRFTPEIIDKVRQEFDERLKKARFLDGSFSYSKTFEKTGEKATLRFTELAMLKMTMLISTEEKEVAWHCVADREEGNSYLITDVLVYPQKVGAASVDMDVDEYGKWKMQGIMDGVMNGDDRFERLYAQGHSHVNMAVTPSPTDLGHQREILDMVGENGFYIFMIWNKRDERNIWIYDLEKNILFENQDITVEVIEEPNGVIQFLRESKKMIKAYTPPASYGTYPSYGGYYSGGYYKGKTESEKKEQAPAKTGGTAPKTVASEGTDKKKVRAAVIRGSCYDDEEDDPASPFYVKDNYYGLE